MFACVNVCQYASIRISLRQYASLCISSSQYMSVRVRSVSECARVCRSIYDCNFHFYDTDKLIYRILLTTGGCLFPKILFGHVLKNVLEQYQAKYTFMGLFRECLPVTNNCTFPRQWLGIVWYHPCMQTCQRAFV